MFEYLPSNFDIKHEPFKSIESSINEIESRAITFGLNYINKIHGTLKNDNFNGIRHSILTRNQSVFFHLKLLFEIHTPARTFRADTLDHNFINQISLRQKFIFDSIIFNQISVFDYLGCLVSLIREQNKDNWKKTWKSCAKYTRGNVGFSNSSLGELIIDVDKNWVDKLSEYRAELIHYKMGSVGHRSSHNFKTNELDIHIFAPKALKKHFKELKENEKIENFGINSISLWLVQTSLNVIIEIFKQMECYIETNRLIPPEKAIFWNSGE